MKRGFIDACEAEQLHLSGAIQPHGALLRFGPDGQITHASENLEEVIGVSAQSALGRAIDAIGIPLTGPAGISGSLNRTSATYLDRPVSVLTIDDGSGGVLVELTPQPETPDTPTHSPKFASERPAADHAEVQASRVRLIDKIFELTGYQRVLYYLFHPDGHGEVVAESRDGDAYGSYFGLHFPASDIPSVARALYLKNPWRMIPDARADSVPVLSRQPETVDLTRSDLRSVSEVHRAYQANMGVRSALSFPVAVDGELVALVSCHHSEPRQPLISSLDTITALVRSHAISLALFGAQQRLRLVDGIARRFSDVEDLLSSATYVDDVWPILGPRLVQDLDADGAMLCIDDRVYSLGTTMDEHVLGAVEQHAFGGAEFLWLSDSLNDTLEQMPLTHVAGAAGVLFTSATGQRVRIWITRTQHISEVSWGGNPDKPLEPGHGDLPISPRRSFETWVERRLGYSRPWTSETELLLRHLRGSLGRIAALKS